MLGGRLPRIGRWRGGKRWLDEGAIFASRVVAILASAVTSAVTARYLGPAGRGEYFFGIVVASLIGQIANYGFSSANLYYSARDPQNIRTILILTISISIFTCAILTSGYFLIVYTNYVPSWKTVFSPFLVYGIALFSLLAAAIPICLIGMRRHFAMAASQILVTLLGVVLILAVAIFKPTIEAFGIAVLVTTGTLPVVCMLLLWPRGVDRNNPVGLESGFTRGWLIYGFRAFPPIALAYLAGRGTIFAAHAAVDAATFGVLSVAYQVFEAMLAAPQSIAMVMFPTLIREGAVNTRSLRKECARMGAFSIGIVFLIAISFPKILILIFGREYEGVYGILLWYLPGFLGYSIVTICSQFLAVFHFPWTNSAAWATGGGVGVVASFYGAEWFGAPGAAAGASIGWLAMAAGLTLVTIYEINRRRAQYPSPEGVVDGA